MSEVSSKVAEMLLSTESIAVYKDKPFVFVSGRISPVYIDCRKLLSFPAEREYIVAHMAKMAETEIGLDKIDVVAGGETAGIPYAAFVAHLIKKPMIYIRKQPKGYGGTKQIEGILEAGQRVLMVEDLITDGLSKLRFNIGVRGAGAKMTHCLCVFDYASERLNQHEGRDNLAKNGIELHVLANWDDVFDTGTSKNYFTEATKIADRRLSERSRELGPEDGLRVSAAGALSRPMSRAASSNRSKRSNCSSRPDQGAGYDLDIRILAADISLRDRDHHENTDSQCRCSSR